MKFNKKISESSRAAIGPNNLDNFEEYALEEKKLPLKPKPVKKVPVSNELYKEESTDLVIHSK